MHKRFRELRDKLAMTIAGILHVLKKPKYDVLAVFLAGLFAVIIYFFINVGFYWPLLVSHLPFLDKLGVVWSMIQEMLHSFVSSFEGFLLFAVSLLQGVAFGVMVYTIKQNKIVDVSAVGTGTFAMIAATFGLGCVPCGTSLIMPIVTLLFSSSAYAVASTASTIVLVIAFGASLFSLYKLGYVAYMHKEFETIKEDK